MVCVVGGVCGSGGAIGVCACSMWVCVIVRVHVMCGGCGVGGDCGI